MKRWAGMVLLAGTVAAYAGEPVQADARLQRALKEAELKYADTAAGDFRFPFTLETGRTHYVVAASKTAKLGGAEVREIWGVGWKGAQEPGAGIVNALLRDNGLKKIGAWQLLQQEDGSFCAVFKVNAPADCSGDVLRAIVSAVAQTADDMEKSLLNTDEL